MVLDNLKIGTKISGVVLGLGLLCIVVAAYGANRIMGIDESYSALTDVRAPAQVSLARASRSANQMGYSAAMAVLSEQGSHAAAEEREAYRAVASEVSRHLDAAARSLPERRNDILGLQDQAKAIQGELDEVIRLAEQGQNVEARAAMIGVAPKLAAYTKANAILVDLSIKEAKMESGALSAETSNVGKRLLLLAALGTTIGVVAALWMSLSSITRPLKVLAENMARLAGGDLETTVRGQDRKDEVGLMARAVQIFKNNGLKARELAADAARLQAEADVASGRAEEQRRAQEAEQAMIVSTLATSLSNLAGGDLATPIRAQFDGQYAQIKSDFNEAVESLREAMVAISDASGAIRGGSEEIASASSDLSRRTEQQAANLEETAAALDQITTTVKVSADGARQASSAAAEARRDAAKSGEVMRDAVAAMVEIEQSSDQITSIIGVIDEIAFQTNLLALNAGVEAARAGEAGRGFAVVAQEVRGLAQRSAEAAKEIKGLIAGSSAHVSRGVQLVGDTERALNGIVAKVAQIDGLISQIAQSSQEQATGLNQVNAAVNQMDQVTQQNAAMVEQATAASANLKAEAARLVGLVNRFNTDRSAAVPARPALADPDRHVPAANPLAQARDRVATFARGAARALQGGV